MPAHEHASSCCRHFTSVGVLGGSPGTTMRGTPGDLNNQIAILEGYAIPGDGGGGVFYWSTTGADDGGTVFGASTNVAEAPVGYWVRIYSGALSVKWFGAKGTSTDDTHAVQSAYRAAAALQSATVYFPAGTYGISSMVTVGDSIGSTFTCISTIGDGPITTVLVWLGSTSNTAPTDTVLRYWRNKYARMVGISVVNGVRSGSAYATGTTIGTLLTGPGSGTQSNGLVFESCSWTGFNAGLQAGGGERGDEAASELVFINCSFGSCTSGFLGQGSGNTLNIWFYGCSFGGNSYGANLGSAGSAHFWGGGSHGNIIATIAPSAWGGTLRVEGFRFELVSPELAIGGGAPALIVENCIFVPAGPVPAAYVVIGGSGTATIRGCVFGADGDTGLIPYEGGQNGMFRSLEMVGNIIYTTVPFYINPINSGSDGLKYSLFGNSYNGVMSGTEVGRVVWPNRVNDIVDGSTTFPGVATVPVTLTTRENASYKVTVSGSANETFWVTNKATTGFTLNSSNAASTASVDWVLSR